MTNYGKTKKSLSQHSLAPSKKFGQNFLVHRHTAEAIVRAGCVGPEDIIVEVGVGLAALTIPLAAVARHVYGIEIDSGIIRFHQEEKDLPANVSLLHQDILKADLPALAALCGGKLKIIANLPYSISNPFIFKLIDHYAFVDRATIMLQKEVADRLTAKPGNKDYGIPSVLLQSCATIEKLMTLGPAEFHPRPKIDSVVIRIVFKQHRDTDDFPCQYKLFQRIVRSAFSQRRKTILNTLSGAGVFSPEIACDKAAIKELTEQTIRAAGFSPELRPEVLSVNDFVTLTKEFGRRIESFSSSEPGGVRAILS